MILWNACSYMQGLKGQEEWLISVCGPSKVVYVRMNALGKAMTTEVLEGRRKSIALNVFGLSHGDLCRRAKS